MEGIIRVKIPENFEKGNPRRCPLSKDTVIGQLCNYLSFKSEWKECNKKECPLEVEEINE